MEGTIGIGAIGRTQSQTMLTFTLTLLEKQGRTEVMFRCSLVILAVSTLDRVLTLYFVLNGRSFRIV